MSEWHHTWETLHRLVRQIAAKYKGKFIHDYRCGKRWDAGQAVCAEFYGPEWNTDPRVLKVNQQPMTDALPDGVLAAAERVLAGTCDWMREPTAPGAAEGASGDE